MLEINIIGKGNVGTSLADALKETVKVNLVDSRSLEGFSPGAQLTLLSVSDNAIEEVARRLPSSESIVCHTSGSMPLSVLDILSGPKGVIYPLQTFTKGVKTELKEIPVFIESDNEKTLKEIEEISRLFFPNVYHADSEKRKQLHLSAVFACNFPNALIGICNTLLKDSGFDFSVVVPLMRQTIHKLETMSPDKAQTGPAARGDTKTMDAHMKMLENYPKEKEVYRLISTIIGEKAGHNVSSK